MESGRVLALRGAVFEGLAGAIFLQRQRRLGVERLGGLLERGAAGIHAKLAVGRRVVLIGGILDQRVGHPHEIEQALELAVIADAKAVKSRDDVDAAVRLALFAFPEMFENALDHIVVAVDMAADEGRRMGERNVELHRHRALGLGGLDEGVQVVTDHLGHAGGRDRDHLRRVKRIGVGEAVDHIVEAAEHRGVLGHRRGHRRRRLLEMTRKMRAVICDAALRAVHERQRLLEARGREYRAQRLARLGRVDRPAPRAPGSFPGTPSSSHIRAALRRRWLEAGHSKASRLRLNKSWYSGSRNSGA